MLLIDARHGIGKIDEAMLDRLDEAAVGYQGVLTKIDKLKAADAATIIAATAERLRRRPAAFPFLVATSAERGDGIAALRATIAGLAAVG